MSTDTPDAAPGTTPDTTPDTAPDTVAPFARPTGDADFRLTTDFSPAGSA
jgi:hypothetical protein